MYAAWSRKLLRAVFLLLSFSKVTNIKFLIVRLKFLTPNANIW